MTRGHLTGETWSFIGFAAIAWLIVVVAGVAMALGNPTAINAVIGCSIPGVAATVVAICFGRKDRRRPRP